MPTLFEQIEDAIDFTEHARRPRVAKAFGIMADILSAAVILLEKLSDPGAADNLEQIIDAAEKVYDKYVVPIDLPLNDIMEAFVERQVRGLIRTTVAVLARKVG